MTDPALGQRPAWRSALGGYPRSAAVGATFAVAWSPCIGPILAGILTLAATSGTAAQGAVLLLAYALGLGGWFLAIGAAFGSLMPRLRQAQPYLPWLTVAGGVLFILVGIALLTGQFARLNEYFLAYGFAFGQAADAEQRAVAGLGGWLGFGVAFLGGMLSFLSPCVLPLVPVYLATLTGEVVRPGEETAAQRRHMLRHAAVFVAGFALVFTILGALSGLAGSAIGPHLDTFTRAGGLLLVVFGLHMSRLARIPFLDRTFQLPSRV
ncbi:MAG: cytochrome c biogenesis protein CcdA [Dehalococcoidia bacterium]